MPTHISAMTEWHLVFLFNVSLGFFLCNVGKICAMLARHLQQPVIIQKLTGPKQKSQKRNVAQTIMPWLVIFPMSGNNTFETSDFADPRFFFSAVRVRYSSTVFLWKKLLRNMKHIISCFLSKEFFSSCLLTWEELNSKWLIEETSYMCKYL